MPLTQPSVKVNQVKFGVMTPQVRDGPVSNFGAVTPQGTVTPDSRYRNECLGKRTVPYTPEGVNSDHKYFQGSTSAQTSTKGTVIRINKNVSGIQGLSECFEPGYTGIREQVTPPFHVSRHIKGLRDQVSDPQVLHEEQCEEISRDSQNDPEVIQGKIKEMLQVRMNH